MARNYAALFHEYLEEFADLTDAEFGRLARALLVYSRTGEFPALNGNERLFKRRVMMQEDRAQERYGAITERNRANGANGGRPKKPKITQDNPKNLNQNQNQNQAFSNEKDITPETPSGVSAPLQRGKRASVFVPPTYEEVYEYNRLRGGLIDPKPFYDYYAAADWRDGEGKPVRNWQQKFIAWELRELDKRKGARNGPEQHNDGDAGKKWDVPGALYL